MPPGVLEITVPDLALAFVPVLAVLAVLYFWSLGVGTAVYALSRMLLQLVLIGYVLNFLFDTEASWLVALVLGVMLVAASWIAMRPIQTRAPGVMLRVMLAILVGCGPVLWLVTQIILSVEPWYQPRYLIPLAGMVFANAMNCVSLAAERFDAERTRGSGTNPARRAALQAALIPLTNSLFAVGLVSLPGMMTGQILAGVDPLIAARYQIVVMTMLFGSSGIAAACYLWYTANAGNQTD